jgi:hypothetical protein
MSLQEFITEQNTADYLRADATFDLSTIKPHIKDAAEQFLYPPLSQEFCEVIFNGTVINETVVTLTREALINFAGYIYLDIAPANLGASGPWENTTAEQKPIRLEVLSNAQNSRLEAGHRKIDLLLAYLEANKVEADFALWKDSQSYTVQNEFLISTTEEFDKYCRIKNSRGIFLALKPAMFQAMSMHIQPLIDMQEIANDLTGTIKAQYNVHLKNAFANYTYAIGIWDLTTAFGFEQILSFNNQTASRQKGFEKLAVQMIEAIETRKTAIASNSLDIARGILIANLPSTPDLEASFPYINDPKKGVFYL